MNLKRGCRNPKICRHVGQKCRYLGYFGSGLVKRITLKQRESADKAPRSLQLASGVKAESGWGPSHEPMGSAPTLGGQCQNCIESQDPPSVTELTLERLWGETQTAGRVAQLPTRLLSQKSWSCEMCPFPFGSSLLTEGEQKSIVHPVCNFHVGLKPEKINHGTKQ